MNSLALPAQAAAPLPQDAGPFIAAGWIVIAAGVVGFLLWASLAPLDKGVPVRGSVIVEGQRKSVLQLNGGQVESIRVSEGQAVNAGDLLITMNDAQARARVEGLQFQYASALALLARLQAERDGLDAIAEPEALRGLPELQQALQSQRRVLAARADTQRNLLASIDETVAGQEQQLQGATETLASKREQRRTVDAQLESLRKLAGDRYIAQTRLLDMERIHAQIEGAIAEDRALIARLKRQIAEAKLRKQTQIEAHRQEIVTSLAEAELNAQTLAQQLQAARYDLDNTLVRAPASGTVVDLGVHTEGGFIGPSTHLLDIVPGHQRLQVQAQVPVELIDSVYPGLPVRLIFSAFNRSSTPQIPALVNTVSADRLLDARTGLPYYRVEAQVTPSGMALLGQYSVRPGMPVEVFIKTGERTLMSYLFKPVRDRMRTALTEE